MRHAHRITVTIETHGAAIDDREHGAAAAILRQVARGIADEMHVLEFPDAYQPRGNEAAGEGGRVLYDANGNKCGRLTIRRAD